MRRKDKRKSSAADLLETFGLDPTTATSPKISRRERKKELKRQKEAQAKKDELLDQLASLRRKLYCDPENGACVTRLEDAISKLMASDDSAADPETVLALDDILKHEVSYATTYASHKNYSALQRSIEEIEQLICDRLCVGHRYMDVSSFKYRLRKNALYAQREELQFRLDENKKRIEQLKTDYENPNLNISKDSIRIEARHLHEINEVFLRQINNTNCEILRCEELLAGGVHVDPIPGVPSIKTGDSIDDSHGESKTQYRDDFFFNI